MESKSLYSRYCRPRVAELLGAARLDVVFDRAEGNYLYYDDDAGESVQVTDFVGSFGAMLFGHNNPELIAVAEATYRQKTPFLAHLSVRSTAARLGHMLDQMVSKSIGRGWVTTLASTGAEAVEVAMKHAEYTHRLRRRRVVDDFDISAYSIREGIGAGRYRLVPEFFPSAATALGGSIGSDFDGVVAAIRDRLLRFQSEPSVFISVERAFHGKTLGAVSLTHHSEYRRHFISAMPQTRFVARDDCAGLRELVRREVVSLPRLEVTLDGTVCIGWAPHRRISALFMEPIQGEGGIHVLSREFLRCGRSLATESDFPLVFDEIQCGMGRTGTFLYAEQAGVTPDYLLLSKSLGGGLAKISAAMIDAEHYEPQFGVIHTSTFAEDDHSAAISLRALELLEQRPAIMKSCAARGRRLKRELDALRRRYPDVIADVRGVGLMLGVELASPPSGGSPTIAELYRQDLVGYIIAGHLLHEHQLRVAPCLSTSRLLRLEPAASISELDCGRLVAALGTLCEILRNQDAYRLLRFVVGVTDGEAPAPSRLPVPGGPARALEVDARVAFIGYFVDAADLRQWDPTLHHFTDPQLRTLLTTMQTVLDPFVVDRKRLSAPDGRSVELLVMGLPLDAKGFDEQMQTGRRAELAARVQDAADRAADEGCVVASLGGYTSIVTGNGMSLRRDRLALTTGNGLTVAMGLRALENTAASQGIRLETSTVAVLGASGNIGSVYARLLSRRAPRVLLVGRPGHDGRLVRFADQLYGEAIRRIMAGTGAGDKEAARTGVDPAIAKSTVVGAILRAEPSGDLWEEGLYRAFQDELGAHAPIEVTSDLMRLREATVIIGASSSPSPIIEECHLRAGPRVICDLAIPTDVHPSLRGRADVAIVDGGNVTLPFEPALRLRGIDLPPGQLFACCAEGVLMGLSGERRHGCLGALTAEHVDHCDRLANRYQLVAAASDRHLRPLVRAVPREGLRVTPVASRGAGGGAGSHCSSSAVPAPRETTRVFAMKKTTTRSTGPTRLHPRTPGLSLDDDVELNWCGGSPFRTQWLNTYTLMIPDGERFVHRALDAVRSRVEGAELRSRVRGLLGQELSHAAEHERFWAPMKRQGLRTEGFKSLFNLVAFRLVEPLMNDDLRLAVASGVEHINAIIAESGLDGDLLEGAEPELRRLFEWHYAEEIEHKSVAYDVLQQLAPGRGLRVAGLTIASANFIIFLAIGTTLLLAQQRDLVRSRTWREGLSHLWGRGRFVPRLLGGLRAYVRSGFHPSQVPNEHLARAVLDAMSPDRAA